MYYYWPAVSIFCGVLQQNNSAGYSKFQKKSNVTSILRICGRNNDCNFEDQVHVVETIKGWLERESGKFLLVKSRILVIGIRNLPRGIQNTRQSWIPLHLGQADWSQVNISGLPGYPNPVKQCRIFMYYPWVIGDMLTWSLCSELFQPLTRMVISSNYKWTSQGPVSTALMQNQLTQVTVNMFIIS